MTSSWSEKLPSAFADAPAPIVVKSRRRRRGTQHSSEQQSVNTQKKTNKHTEIEN